MFFLVYITSERLQVSLRSPDTRSKQSLHMALKKIITKTNISKYLFFPLKVQNECMSDEHECSNCNIQNTYGMQ